MKKHSNLLTVNNFFVSKVLVFLLSTAVFIYRDLTFFKIPNFLVEDATVIFNNIYSLNPLDTVTTLFNGYFILGQYLLGYIAVGINFLFGGSLLTLPTITAVVSCAFLGLAASLPFLLFRKQMGTWLALITVIFLSLIPMYSYDYAIIGSLSNLKFIFLYIAFMLCMYRIVNKELSRRKILVLDALLFMCVLTNVTVAFVIPVLLLPYARQLCLKLLRKKTIKKPDFSTASAAVLSALSLVYVAGAFFRGIPEIPGYLDTPFKAKALLPIVERSTTYAWAYPINSVFNNKFVFALLVLVLGSGLYLFIKRKKDRMPILMATWAIFLGTTLFVINRPGVSEYYLSYGHKGGPDQFFYAQNMIFIFITAWLLRDYFKKIKFQKVVFASILCGVYLLLAIPNGSSFGNSSIVYKSAGTIDYNLEKACREYADKPKVIIQIYVNAYWQWSVDKDLACNR